MTDTSPRQKSRFELWVERTLGYRAKSTKMRVLIGILTLLAIVAWLGFWDRVWPS
jgi:hypothetical protein